MRLPARRTEIEQARRRLARYGLLRWLLDFCRRPLDPAPRPGALADLEIDVLAFLAPAGLLGVRGPVRLSLANIRDFQKDVLKGVTGILENRGWSLGKHEVEMYLMVDAYHPKGELLNPPHRRFAQEDRVPPGEAERVRWPLRLLTQPMRPTLRLLFQIASAQEVEKGWDQIRRCRSCRLPFVPVRRQRFCSKDHTQRWVNDTRKKEREDKRRPAPGRRPDAGRSTRKEHP